MSFTPLELRTTADGQALADLAASAADPAAARTPPRRRARLRILGIRGVPAAHGGFETFAERLSLYLVGRGWEVVVYCQEQGRGPIVEDEWCGVQRVRIAVPGDGAASTIHFDWLATLHAARHDDVCLTLGYNTAVFGALLRARGVPNVTNMDGIEWRRAKWGPLARAWFYVNERAGCWISNHLIADHPQIAAHLSTRVSARKITTIGYGADPVRDPPVDAVRAHRLEPRRYVTLIARPEPENSILEAVEGFSRKRRDCTLAVLGHYGDDHPYQREVRRAAGSEVAFLGPLYDRAQVNALRYHALGYIHGHQVGGTNPSLVEALAAANPVIAHDNRFNRWVAGDHALYFRDPASFDEALSALLADAGLAARLGAASSSRFEEAFRWPGVLARYESLLERYLDA